MGLLYLYLLPSHLALLIYISYRSVAPHIIKLDTVQLSFPNYSGE